jgi:hypothetical protein
MPSRPISTRISDPTILAWLESRQNISDTVREALIRMKQGEELSDDLLNRLNQLFKSIRAVDKKLDAALKEQESE